MSKKQTEPIVSAMGVLTSLITMLVEAVKAAGGTMECLYRLVTPEGAETLRRIAKIIAEDAGSFIRVVVSVNRTRTPQQVLDATGRRQYTDPKVVDSMPSGEGAGAEVVFFQVGRYISNAELEKEYELRGLRPCDPYTLAAINEADPALADTKPNGTHWQDASGNWCYVAFRHWHGVERRVEVDRHGSGWYGHWWFAGLRK